MSIVALHATPELVKVAFQALAFLACHGKRKTKQKNQQRLMSLLGQIRENQIYLDGAIGLSVRMLRTYQTNPSVSIHILGALTNF